MASNGANGTVDLRGEFIRGWDAGRGVDPGRIQNSFQADAFRSHSHGMLGRYGGYRGTWRPMSGAGAGSNFTAQTQNTGGNETRPRNRAMLYCQKE